MKKYEEIVRAVIAFLLMLLFPATIWTGQAPALTEADIPPELHFAWAAFIGLVGWPMFQVAAINLLKVLKFLPDGYAAKVTYWSTIAMFGAVAFLVFTGQTELLAAIDARMTTLARILTDIAILYGGAAGSLAVNRLVYEKVRGYPVIGHSNDKGYGETFQKPLT